tara:strand:- start:3872 stop:4120 length:249 start_codon:yes stop_codon:yes gene_type:complete
MNNLKCNTSNDIKVVLMVLETFADNKEDILTALELCVLEVRKVILEHFCQNTIPKIEEDGHYLIDSNGKNYSIGIKSLGSKQ